jgi:hypothetical protein
MMIMAHPKGHPVIRGTGGVRKMRFSALDSNSGKSGDLRVCYVYFEESHIVLLALLYPKSKKLDLTPEERKNLCILVERQRKALSNGRYN